MLCYSNKLYDCESVAFCISLSHKARKNSCVTPLTNPCQQALFQVRYLKQ